MKPASSLKKPVVLNLHAKQSAYPPCVSLGKDVGAGEAGFRFLGTLAQEVALAGLEVLDFTTTRHLETLFRTGVRFHLRHDDSFYEIDK